LHEPGQVKRLALQVVEPARLVGRVQGGGEQSGRDEDEDQAGDAEEAGEVDADAAAVDAEADRDRGDEADDWAGAPAAVVSVESWKAASRKTEVSKPSRSTARKAIPTRAMVEPLASALAALPSSTFFIPRALRRIQMIM
jgi:hypothetical protein